MWEGWVGGRQKERLWCVCVRVGVAGLAEPLRTPPHPTDKIKIKIKTKTKIKIKIKTKIKIKIKIKTNLKLGNMHRIEGCFF